MYYLRTRPAANAIQFTVDTKAVKEARQKQQNTAENKENVRGKQVEEEEAGSIHCFAILGFQRCHLCF